MYVVLSVHNFGPHFLEDTVKEKVFLEKLTILSLALPHKNFLRQKNTMSPKQGMETEKGLY